MPPQPGCRELGGAQPDTNRQRPDKVPDPTRLKSVRELKLRGSQEAGTPGGRAGGGEARRHARRKEECSWNFPKVQRLTAGLQSKRHEGRAAPSRRSSADLLGAREKDKGWQGGDSVPQHHGCRKRKETCWDSSPLWEECIKPLGEGQQNLLPPRALVKTQHAGDWVKEKNSAPAGEVGTCPWALRPPNAERGTGNSFLHKTHHQGRAGCH